ncbi:MAG: class I SAM-dependent methyltransferase [Pseudomonas sp.]|uniref:class I SAM-dependent methyltransferase n=1 Tax=Pseudomonas sp. TaxID=306 RepID=UPI00339999C3
MVPDLPNADARARTRRSQQYFNRFSLFFYDRLLYGLVSRRAWSCPPPELDRHYARSISQNHLEVGVGTGYLLDRATGLGPTPRLALLDLSSSCLEKTARRVARYAPTLYQRNLLEPIVLDAPGFDSIAVNFVLHCVPGGFAAKGVAFDHLKPLLNPGGVLFGATVLNRGVQKKPFARLCLALLNGLGVFNNRADDLHELRACLQRQFSQVEVRVMGVTALFVVRV